MKHFGFLILNPPFNHQSHKLARKNQTNSQSIVDNPQLHFNGAANPAAIGFVVNLVVISLPTKRRDHGRLLALGPKRRRECVVELI